MSGTTAREPRFTFTGRAHELLAEVVGEGAFAVDATAGRGRDTAFLARLVGSTGRVLAIDVQAEAIRSTAERLEREGLADRVELIQGDHRELFRWLGPQRVQGALFNLGFLPGASRDVVTSPASTIAALRSVLDALAPGGRVVVIGYVGHAGGRAEAAEVLRHVRSAKGVVLERFGGPHRSGRREAPRLCLLRRS